MILRKLTAWLFCATTFVFMLGGVPAANAYLFGGAPVAVVAPPFPTTQNVSFGQIVAYGYGGSTMQYTNQAVLGVSRWLKITAQVNNASASGTYFGIDDRNMLVPCAAITSNKCSSTYGSSSTRTATPYTVTVAEYSDSGRTVPTGNQSVITVNTVANQLFVREMTSSGRGCTVNCEVDNPDGGGSFNADTWQESVALATPLVNLGNTIVGRDGWFNPTSLEYNVLLPASPYTGSGCLTAYLANCITVTSENPTAGNDTDGNPIRGGGYKLGGFHYKAFLSGDVLVPINHYKVTWDVETDTTDITAMLYVNDNATSYGWGVNFSRLVWGCAITHDLHGVDETGKPDLNDNALVQCPYLSNPTANGGAGLNISGGSNTCGGGGSMRRNIFSNFHDDGIDTACGPFNQDDNFFYNWVSNSDPVTGKHPDTMQNNGAPDGTTNNSGGTAYRNITVRGNGIPNSEDTQGVPFNNNTGGPLRNGTYLGTDVQNNISTLTAGNSTFLENTNSPTIYDNTDLTLSGITIPPPAEKADPATIFVENGTNATVKGNLSNIVDLTGQGGTVTTADNITISFTAPTTPALYTTCFPNYVAGENALAVTRAYVIHEFTPAVQTVGTSCRSASGHYAGSLTPADVTGNACWNTLTMLTFDPSLTCAAQGLTQAS